MHNYLMITLKSAKAIYFINSTTTTADKTTYHIWTSSLLLYSRTNVKIGAGGPTPPHTVFLKPKKARQIGLQEEKVARINCHQRNIVTIAIFLPTRICFLNYLSTPFKVQPRPFFASSTYRFVYNLGMF